LHDLYHLLEEKFQPLELCAVIKPKLDFIAEHVTLKQYLLPLQKLLFIRLLQQLSKVYQTLKLSSLISLVSFLNPQSLEKLIVESVKNKFVDLRLDHQKGVINFGSQVLEANTMRHQLTELAKNLQQAVEMIHPKLKQERKMKKQEEFKKKLSTIEEEHRKLLERKLIIEKKERKIRTNGETKSIT